jgi:hypothetical protein
MELSPEIEQGLYTLHQLEARLCLLGFENISALLETHRQTLTGITLLDDFKSFEDRSAFCTAYLQLIMKTRLALLRAMAHAYNHA